MQHRQRWPIVEFYELRRLRPERSSFSVSISRVCTHIRKDESPRAASQLRSSIKARFIPSLTSKSLCSSAEISQRVSSSGMVSRVLSRLRWASSHPLQRARARTCLPVLRSLLRECRRGETGEAEGALSEARVGEVEGEEKGDAKLVLLVGRIWSRWMHSVSCCSWRSIYFCSARLWQGVFEADILFPLTAGAGVNGSSVWDRGLDVSDPEETIGGTCAIAALK